MLPSVVWEGNLFAITNPEITKNRSPPLPPAKKVWYHRHKVPVMLQEVIEVVKKDPAKS